ncbi:MAG: outer membrane lipoprotein-sorting protein [bacterium]
MKSKLNNQDTISNNQLIINNQLSIINSRIVNWLLGFGHCLVIVSWLLVICVPAAGLTGEQIINRVDQNMTFSSSKSTAKMLIYVGDQIRTKEMVSYAQGRDKSFSEFTAPARDKGVKYLKIDDNMWMYLPSVDKTIKIAGHMLRQSMMGSDFSYEDALESDQLLDKYDVKLVGEEDGSYILELTAKVKEVTYFKRKLWVDKTKFVPVKEELFAKSGKKLKVMELTDIKKFGSRYYPTKITLKNLLRKDSKTEMMVESISFDVGVPAKIFSKANLTK